MREQKNRMDERTSRDLIQKLQEPVEIPQIVQERAQQALTAVLQQAKEEGKEMHQVKGKRYQKKKWILAAAAIVAALGTVSVGAAAYMKWNRGLERNLHVEQGQKEELETSKMVDWVEQSAADQGVTITAVQSVVDNYYAYIALRVEGYEVPQGAEPAFETVDLTVDGVDVNWGAYFYNGLTSDENGRPIHEDGTRVSESDGDIEQFVREDGSMDYVISLYHNQEPGAFFGKPIHIELTNLGTTAKADYTPVMEGRWSFDWVLQGSGETYQYQLKEPAPVGDTDVIVLGAEVSPVSMRVMCEVPREQYTIMEEDADVKPQPPALCGAVMKDGTVYPYLASGGGSTGYESEKSDRLVMQFGLERIIEVDQIQSLLFAKPWDETMDYQEYEALPWRERFYEVSLS